MLLTAQPPARVAAHRPRKADRGFRRWRRQRPFVGGLLLVLSGIEIFLSTQLELGAIKLQMGLEGFQAVIIPIGLALLGVLAVAMPAHHLFYGIIALVVAIYSIIGVNLGGFFVGMILGAVGGILVVSWARPRDGREAAAAETSAASAMTPVADDAMPRETREPEPPTPAGRREDETPLPSAEFVPLPPRKDVRRS